MKKTERRIKTLYGYAIKKGYVGRRTLQSEFDLTRTEAESVLHNIRNPSENELLFLKKIEGMQYDNAADDYTFYGTNEYGNEEVIAIDGEVIRSLKRDYTMGGFTMEQTAYRNDISVRTFRRLHKQFEWTHESIPATDEEVASEGVDELVDRLQTEQRKMSVRSQLQKSEWRQLEKDAEKFREIEVTLLDAFDDILERHGRAREVPTLDVKPLTDEQHCMVLPVFDMHFGKAGLLDETGSAYSKEQARDTLLTNVEEVVADIMAHNVEEIKVGFGSDFFHVDTSEGTTTLGTGQDMDGSPASIFTEGTDLMIEYIDALRQTGAKITGYMVPGNHDKILSVALMKVLVAHYRTADRVEIVESLNPRQYCVYGDTLLGFEHGDGVTDKRLQGVVMDEARSFVSDTKETVIFTGHLHHELVKEIGALRLYQLGSPSGNDRYHHGKAFTSSRKQMHGYLISRVRGMRYAISYPVLI